MATILVVEDEHGMLETLCYNLEREGYRILRATRAKDALELLEVEVPELILSDIMMPGMDGLEFCAEVRLRDSTRLTPFVFLSAKHEAEDKVAGLRLGADDYVTKPFDMSDLLARIAGRLAHRETIRDLEREISVRQSEWRDARDIAAVDAANSAIAHLTKKARSAGHILFSADPTEADLRRRVAEFELVCESLLQLRTTILVGESSVHLAYILDLLVASSTSDPTLLVGEPGTGKSVSAEALWKLSGRSDGPFVTVNCSELLGSDTTTINTRLLGSHDDQGGALADANGGVLLLDEITDLPKHSQRALVAPYEGRPYCAVRGSSTSSVDVKYVAATNRDIGDEMRAGRFSRALYQRFRHVVRVPPLRERTTDIHILARHFLSDTGSEDTSFVSGFTPSYMKTLCRFDWPGNVRQLKCVVRNSARRAQLRGSRVITLSDIATEVAIDEPSSDLTSMDPRFTARERSEILALRKTSFSIARAERALGYSSRSRTLSHRLRGICLKALSLSHWNVSTAAKLLAGDDNRLAAAQTRRLHSVLDGLSERLSDNDDKIMRHFLVEHRVYVKEACEWLRRTRQE